MRLEHYFRDSLKSFNVLSRLREAVGSLETGRESCFHISPLHVSVQPELRGIVQIFVDTIFEINADFFSEIRKSKLCDFSQNTEKSVDI